MLGIESIGIYIPKNKINNLEQADRFETDRTFLEQKIGAIDLPRFERGNHHHCMHSSFSSSCSKNKYKNIRNRMRGAVHTEP